MQKHCRICGLIKNLSDFYTHPKMPDGHLNQCKDCRIQYAARYSKTPKGKVVERRRNQKRKVYLYAMDKKMKKKWRHKYLARSKVTAALRCGRLKKAACQLCGNQNLKQIDAHHVDYGKPLDVVWLCRRGTEGNCHNRAHSENLKLNPLIYVSLQKIKLLKDLEGEKWQDIAGYENYYQISSFGRVKSLERTTAYIRFLKFNKDRSGCLRATFSKKGIMKTVYLSTLIKTHPFLPF